MPAADHRPCRPPTRRAASALALLIAVPALAQLAPDVPPAATTTPQRQTLAEFLDSLSDNVLNADRSEIYRIEGRKRIVTLRSGWTATLDEQASGRLANGGGGPGTAGPPGKSFEIGRDTDTWQWRLYTRKDSTSRESGVSGAWTLAPGWQLRGQSFNLRDPDTSVKRRETDAGLRFGDASAWVEPILRRVALNDPRPAAAGLVQPDATFAGMRAAWRPDPVPGLTLQAEIQRALSSHTEPGHERLADGRTELGADYRLDGLGLPGARVYWREALDLGLLASDGLDERTTYQRTVGGEIGDGSPDGRIYLQWREHSLSESRNALLVVGWRHAFAPAPRWRFETMIEQAEPAQGPSAIRSTTLGLRATHSAHPHHTLTVETEAVRSSLKDSAYGSVKYTHRLTENTLAAWRVQVTDQHPHEPGLIPSTETKASFGWAWREPVERQTYTLWRYTLIDREQHGEPAPTPDASDRRAYIALGQVGGHWFEASEWSLRGSRRWDYDEAVAEGSRRVTTLVVARHTWPIYRRWSGSAHLAQRRDRFDATQTGIGAEIGYRLSSKASLAIGYNLKGVDDSELELDDRLKKGFTIRLRFSVDTAAARWLDPTMEQVRAAAGW